MVRRNKGRQFGAIVLAALFTLVFALPAAAQNGKISGIVKDGQGKPVEGAKVLIVNEASGRKFESTTDKSGGYLQLGLGGGTFKITVTKEGAGTVSMGGIAIRVAQPRVLDITLAPTASMVLGKNFDEGIAESKAGHPDEAIAKFNAALALNPACAECYYNIGFTEAERKDYDKAEAAYKKAIEVRASYADAYSGLANIYNQQRKFDLAGEASKKAAELSAPAGAAGGAAGAGGASPDALFNQGVILWNSGKTAEAKAAFEATIAAKPDHAEAHYQLGMALVNGGDLKGAGTEFETYLKLAPNGPNAAQAKALAAQLPK